MEPNEVIIGVLLPRAAKPAPFEFVRPFKQARRRASDSSIVTAGEVFRSVQGRGLRLVDVEAPSPFVVSEFILGNPYLVGGALE